MSYKKFNTKLRNHIFTKITSSGIIISKQAQLQSITKNSLIVCAKKHFISFSKPDILKFINEPVELFLSQYEFFFFGLLQNISHNKLDCHFVIDFPKATPSYYKACMRDLLISSNL